MKIKKFSNIWAMGLIMFGAILVALYLIKLIAPSFVVGVAEADAIVAFGNYVDAHKWAYYLFNTVTSFIVLYFYCCACCRVKSLGCKENIVIIISILLYNIVCEFLPDFAFVYSNVVSYILLPLIIVLIRKIKDFNVFYSTTACFAITSFAQVISLAIRDISTMLSYPNTATYFVLLIDLYIWNGLLYCFYNYKGGKKNGKNGSTLLR